LNPQVLDPRKNIRFFFDKPKKNINNPGMIFFIKMAPKDVDCVVLKIHLGAKFSLVEVAYNR
jgi:hypothetical protein